MKASNNASRSRRAAFVHLSERYRTVTRTEGTSVEKLANRPSLPDLYKFQRQFEAKYHQKMTDEERHTFEAIEHLLLHPPEEEQRSGEAEARPKARR